MFSLAAGGCERAETRRGIIIVGIIRSHFSPEFVISCSLFPFIAKRMTVHAFSLPVSLRLALRSFVGAYSLFIIWASLRPTGTGNIVPHLDKLIHLVVYGLLGATIALAWPKFSKLKIFWGCVGFGAALELAQGFMAVGRSASFFDSLANSLGAAIGVSVIAIIARKLRK